MNGVTVFSRFVFPRDVADPQPTIDLVLGYAASNRSLLLRSLVSKLEAL